MASEDNCTFFLLKEQNLDIFLEFSTKCELVNYIQKNDLHISIFLCKRKIDVDFTKILANIFKELNEHILYPIVTAKDIESQPKIVVTCEEFFYIQRQNKKKLIFWSLSLMDGGNLIHKLKGEKSVICKKNQLAQYIYTKEEGDKYMESTMDFLFKFFKMGPHNIQTPIDGNFEASNKALVESKTTAASSSQLGKVFFIDTLDKTSLYGEIRKKCEANKKDYEKFRQFLFLEKTLVYLSKIKSKTKTQKIPVMMVFRYDDSVLQFSLQHIVYWLTTHNSVISI